MESEIIKNVMLLSGGLYFIGWLSKDDLLKLSGVLTFTLAIARLLSF